MKKDRLNNFQKKETVRWLLNISQAVVVGGAGSIFVPGVSEKVGTRLAVASILLALALYLISMFISQKVKGND